MAKKKQTQNITGKVKDKLGKSVSLLPWTKDYLPNTERVSTINKRTMQQEKQQKIRVEKPLKR